MSLSFEFSCPASASAQLCGVRNFLVRWFITFHGKTAVSLRSEIETVSAEIWFSNRAASLCSSKLKTTKKKTSYKEYSTEIKISRVSFFSDMVPYTSPYTYPMKLIIIINYSNCFCSCSVINDK